MPPSAPLLAVTGGMRLGGSTTFLLNLGRGFRELGATLPIICMTGENEMQADFAEAGVAVHRLPGRALIYEDRTRRAYTQAAAQGPNGVLACLGSDSFEVLRVVPRPVLRLGIIQSDDPGPYEMARHYAPSLDVMVGVSETICRKLRADSAWSNTRIECIPYGIHFEPEDARAPRPPVQPLRIIYLGRLIETQKRVSRLVELARLLTARGLPFEFTFAGSGPELPTVQEALRGFSHVHFPGNVPNRQISELLRSQDVFVLLSDYEGLPLSLLESMGAGVVPVVSDLESGMREVVTAETGIRVPAGNVTAAAEAILFLARNPERLADFSAAAGRLARSRFGAARMAQRYLALAGGEPRGAGIWTAEVNIPTPLLVRHAWMYRGLGRRVRRLIKRALNLRPA
jgi:glycosyltransferase involved in cell wall biosynthesis